MELFCIQTVDTARYTYRKCALGVLSLKLKLVVSYGLALKRYFIIAQGFDRNGKTRS